MRIGAHLHRQRDNDALRPAPSRPAALMSRFIGSTCSQRRVSGGSAGAAQVQAAAAEAGQQPSPRPAASIDERACLLILRKVITQANEATVASVLSRQSQRDGTAATSGAAGAAPAAAATAVLPLVLAYDERMLMHSSFVEPHLEG